jgi:hypothetical protein
MKGLAVRQFRCGWYTRLDVRIRYGKSRDAVAAAISVKANISSGDDPRRFRVILVRYSQLETTSEC